jgi:hypothetical protein
MSEVPSPSGAILSTRKLLPFGAAFTSRVAEACRPDSVDIDLTWTLPGAVRSVFRLDSSDGPSAVLWIPARTDPARTMTADSPVVARWLPTCPVLVIDLPPHPSEQMAGIAAAYRIAEKTANQSSCCQVAIGLRASHLLGGRRHLVNLTLLRRRTEEWGIAIALDLTGAFDPLWEAEAAVLRLGGRLALVRINSGANLPSAVDRDRVARRAVRAAIEQCRDLRVSIEPDVAWWQRRNVGAVADAWTLSARRIYPWGGPSSQGVPPIHEERRRHRSLPPR